jgi:hypothetical protein
VNTDPGKASRGMVILQREEWDLADEPRARADSAPFLRLLPADQMEAEPAPMPVRITA